MSEHREAALEALRDRMREAGAEALLVSQPENVRYLSDFRSPEDARVLITGTEVQLVTDGRYLAQAAEETSLEVLITPSSDWMTFTIERIAGKRLAVEGDHLTYDQVLRCAEVLESEPIPLNHLLRDIRMVKTEREVERLREAARLTDAAFDHILGFIGAGKREVEIALELERFLRLSGAEGVGFDIIVASGERSAMPHGTASQRVIESGDLVTMDFGAVLDGYHADMTRAVAIGALNGRLGLMYEAVHRAQETALQAVGPGKSGRELDEAARAVLADYDLEAFYTHGLGHGVGLAIHEAPSLSVRSDAVLQAGMTVTIEPGVYLPGEGGVRIEDLVVVTDEGYERLSMSPKGLITV